MNRYKIVSDLNLTAYHYVYYSERPEDVQSLHFDNLHQFDFKTVNIEWMSVNDCFLEVPHCDGSDYSGSLVTLTNYKALLKKYEEQRSIVLWDYFGYFNTYGLLLSLNGLMACDEEVFESIINDIKSLQEYPLFDEEAYSLAFVKAEEEAWDSWVEFDYRQGLESKFQQDVEIDLLPIFDKVCEENSECYQEDSGGNLWIDVEKLVDKTTRNNLNEPTS